MTGASSLNIVQHHKGKVYISGDYHLLPNESPSALIKLSKQLQEGDQLLILGDLFEVWYENLFRAVPGYQQILDLFNHCHQQGIGVHLIKGNRDFMASRQFQRLSNASLYDGPVLFDSGKNQLLAIHGDELLTDDKSYQKFKRFSRHPLTLGILHILPLSLLRFLCGRVRKKSIKKVSSLSGYDYKPNLRDLEPVLANLPTQEIIAGHLHRDLKCKSMINQLERTCTILPDSHAKDMTYRIWDGQALSELQTLEA